MMVIVEMMTSMVRTMTNCTRRVEPVWQADKCRSSRAPPGFDIVIMCNISNLLVFGTLVEFFFDHIWSKAIIVLRPLVLSTPPDSCNHIRAASKNSSIDCETSKFGICASDPSINIE